MTDANEVAKIIDGLVVDRIAKAGNKYLRGVIASINPTDKQKANVYIEGNSVATQNIMSVDAYGPVIGDKVIVLSIGDSGSNLLILGSITGTGDLNVSGDIYSKGKRVTTPIHFAARKTSDQNTGTSGSAIRINFESSDVYGGDQSLFSGSQFIAPADGWLEVSCTLTIIGGTGNDDSMAWGFYNNGAAIEINDNWRYNSPSGGIEFNTSFSTAFRVVKDENIRIGFDGVTTSVTLMANRCHFSGTFTPN